MSNPALITYFLTRLCIHWHTYLYSLTCWGREWPRPPHLHTYSLACLTTHYLWHSLTLRITQPFQPTYLLTYIFTYILTATYLPADVASVPTLIIYLLTYLLTHLHTSTTTCLPTWYHREQISPDIIYIFLYLLAFIPQADDVRSPCLETYLLTYYLLTCLTTHLHADARSALRLPFTYLLTRLHAYLLTYLGPTR